MLQLVTKFNICVMCLENLCDSVTVTVLCKVGGLQFYFVFGISLGLNGIDNYAGHTAKKKTRRKGNRGYQGLLFVAQQPSPPPPPTHAPRAYWIGWGCVIRTHPPPPPNSTFTQAKISDF